MEPAVVRHPRPPRFANSPHGDGAQGMPSTTPTAPGPKYGRRVPRGDMAASSSGSRIVRVPAAGSSTTPTSALERGGPHGEQDVSPADSGSPGFEDLTGMKQQQQQEQQRHQHQKATRGGHAQYKSERVKSIEKQQKRAILCLAVVIGSIFLAIGCVLGVIIHNAAVEVQTKDHHKPFNRITQHRRRGDADPSDPSVRGPGDAAHRKPGGSGAGGGSSAQVRRPPRKSALSMVLDGDGFPPNEDNITTLFGSVTVVVATRAADPATALAPIFDALELQHDAPRCETDSKADVECWTPAQHLREVHVVVSYLAAVADKDAVNGLAQTFESRINKLQCSAEARRTGGVMVDPTLKLAPVSNAKSEQEHGAPVPPGLGAMYNAGVEQASQDSEHVLFHIDTHRPLVPLFNAIDGLLHVYYTNAPSGGHDEDAPPSKFTVAPNGDVGQKMRVGMVTATSLFSATDLQLDTAMNGTDAKPHKEVLPSHVAATRTAKARRARMEALSVLDKGFHTGLGSDRFQAKSFIVRRLMGIGGLDARVAKTHLVDWVGANFALVNLKKFIRAGGFFEQPVLLDRVISGSVDLSAVHKSAEVVRFRIMSVERIMEAISLNEVHQAGMELRQLVRTTYAEVVDATGVWEEVTQQTFDVQGYDFEGTALEKKEKQETAEFGKMTTVQKLKAAGKRLHEAVTTLRSAGKHRDSSATDDTVGWDLSLRFRDAGIASFAAGVPVEFNGKWLPEQYSKFVKMNKIDLVFPSYGTAGSFQNEWGNQLKEWFAFQSGEEHNPLRVIWDTICCGCCGFSSEIVNFVYPLEKRRSVQILPNYKNCFCKGYAPSVADAIQRVHITNDQYVLQRGHFNEVVIWIAHSDPMTYRTNLQTRRVPDYVIGRSMYEFSRIGRNWVKNIEKYADEVWAPAAFVRQVFIDSGVPEDKVVIVPEAVDTDFFDASIHTPMPLPLEGKFKERWFHFCNHAKAPEDPYIFFSNFKWEPRKGWNLLFRAYNDAFGAKSGYTGRPVSLYVLSYIFQGSHYQGDIHNITYIQNQMQDMLKEEMGGIPMSKLPHFCIITETITEDEMARLYAAMDAFVLPTRGEGWGLPPIQAMSMGKPTITTNWGGNTEFTKQYNSFLIPLHGVEEVDKDSVYGFEDGKKWATPSIDGLRDLMRYVVENPEHAARVGRRARQYVVERFSLEAIATVTDQRLRAIRDRVIAGRARR